MLGLMARGSTIISKGEDAFMNMLRKIGPAWFSHNGAVVAKPSVEDIKEGEPMIRTHRCRLYRLEENVYPDEDLFTEVWDFEESPCTAGELPEQVKLVASFTGQTEGAVREKLDTFCERHNYYLVGDWESRGSI